MARWTANFTLIIVLSLLVLSLLTTRTGAIPKMTAPHAAVASAGQPTRYLDLRVPHAQDTIAVHINDQGQIVGFSGGIFFILYFELFGDPHGHLHGFLWSHGVFTRIDAPHARQGTYATGINNRGEIVGFYFDRSGTGHGFVRSQGRYYPLDRPKFDDVWAIGINDHDQIAGVSDDGDGSHGFLRSQGVYTPIQVPHAAQTWPMDINNQGEMVGTYYDNKSKQHGFLLSHGVYTTIDPPDADGYTWPMGINDAGDIVGQYVDRQRMTHGFLLRRGIYHRIDPPSGNRQNKGLPSKARAFLSGPWPTGINNRGQIVGSLFLLGRHPPFRRHPSNKALLRVVEGGRWHGYLLTH